MTEVKTFRLEKEIAVELRRAAKRIERKPNWIVNTALTRYLAELASSDARSEARRQAALLRDETDDWEKYIEAP